MLTRNRKGRPHGFFLCKATQYGDTNPPGGFDILDTDIPGAAPTWSRNAAGNYSLTFPASSLSEDYCVAFVQVASTSAARYATLTVSDGNLITIIFRDEAGVAVEADCSFYLLIYNYAATIPA
ncbi:MAG: hypothetical protein O7B25_12915 [Gammaproteobacteria bacterium]|nr:hypothetical protein [Gammaproteobacteria bacterium]